MRRDAYPVCYKDPDIVDAEHLAHAAYHLIEAGRCGMAQVLIDRICEAFRDVPVNKRQKSACKVLGETKYFPYGVITVPGPHCDLAIPAPAYDTDMFADMRQGASGRADLACKQCCLSWFSSKQAAAAIKQKQPSVTAFRPALILERIKKLCAGWDPGMPPETAAIIADKLNAILEKNPISHMSDSAVCRDLWTHGTRYAYSDYDSSLWGFKYLPESQVLAAKDILSNDNGSQARALDRLQQSKISWNIYLGEEIRRIRDDIQSGSGAAMEQAPFTDYYRQVAAESDNRRQMITTTAAYVLKERVLDALDAARDVCNLVRAHEALRRHPDRYIHGVLAGCRIISDSLEIPENLHVRAMRVMAARAFTIPETYKCDESHVRMAYDAVEILSGAYGLPEAMDHPLLHHVEDPEESPET